MKLLADDIYDKISAIVPNTYFSQLPANIDSSQNFCVYELEVDESKNTLHERDFEQGVEIIVRVLSKDIGYLFDTVESIRQAVLQHTANYYSPIVKNTIPVFYDENLKLHQYSIVFGVNRGSIPFTGTLVNKYAPDAIAIVQDQDGNELARENIPSGESRNITVNIGGGDATVLLFNSEGTLLSTTTIPAGQTRNITAPDGEIRIERTDGTIIGGGNQEVPSDGLVTFVVPDSQYQVLNSDNTEILFGQTPAQRFLSLDFPDTTVNIVDQFGNPIKSESVPSGTPQDIEVNISSPLYVYAYDELNTGQDVSYATGDDKDIRDTVFSPEINSWPTDRPLVKPILDPTDPTKLLRGSNPDGSGNNIFGNKERFTNVDGTGDYSTLTGVGIDHYIGEYFVLKTTTAVDWEAMLLEAQALTVEGINNFHLSNDKEFISLYLNNASIIPQINRLLSYLNNIGSASILASSSTRVNNTNFYNRYTTANIYDNSPTIKSNVSDYIAFAKAFTYNPSTQQMELI